MSSIRVPGTGTVEERLRRLEQACNYSEAVLCCGIVDEQGGATVTTTAVQVVGGWTIPWAQLRELLPDERWLIWAAGWATCTGGCVFQVTYQRNDQTSLVLGQQTMGTTFAWQKLVVGPFPARGSLVAITVPQDEQVHSLNLTAAVNAGATLTLKRWTMWLRMSPRTT